MEGTACAEAQGLYSASLGCRGCVYGGVVAAGKYEEMSFPRLYRDLCAQLGSLNFYLPSSKKWAYNWKFYTMG